MESAQSQNADFSSLSIKQQLAELPVTGTLADAYSNHLAVSAPPEEESQYFRLIADAFAGDKNIIAWGMQDNYVRRFEQGYHGLPLQQSPMGVTLEPWQLRDSKDTILLITINNLNGAATVVRRTDLTAQEINSFATHFDRYLHPSQTVPVPKIQVSDYDYLNEGNGGLLEGMIRRWGSIRHVLGNQMADVSNILGSVGFDKSYLLPRSTLKLAYLLERHNLMLRLARSVLHSRQLSFNIGAGIIQRSINPDCTHVDVDPAIENLNDEAELFLHIIEAARNAYIRAGAGEVRIAFTKHNSDQGTKLIRIADDGQGFNPAFIDSAFGMGVSGAGGSGQGLAYIQQFMHSRAGIIRVKSFNSNLGTNFHHVRHPDGNVIQENLSPDDCYSGWQRPSGSEFQFFLPD